MNIIFGVYDGYKSLKTNKGGIYYFMRSLRKYSNCKVIIICQKHNIFKELAEFAMETNFEIYSDFELKYQMMYCRFVIYKQYLEKNNSVINKILLSDINDVIFQDDPFNIEFSEDLYCALEGNILNDKTNSSSLINIGWIRECIGSESIGSESIGSEYINPESINPECVDMTCLKPTYVVCAGTILGNYGGILRYLKFYDDFQNKRIENNQEPVNDQGLLNVYVYKYLKSKNMPSYANSRILTLDRIDFHLLLIQNNQIINSNNEKYNIIHQIDRCHFDFMIGLV